MFLAFIALAGALLAYANGANDNFKGVATLLGSGTASYRRALLWAAATTALGSLAGLVLARELLVSFTGRGLVPEEVVTDPVFPAAVALSAGATVLLATRVGMPISTTHALVGALVGAGLVVSPTGVDSDRVADTFLLPLLTSPFLAAVLAGSLYPPLRRMRRKLSVSRETCVCIGEEVVGIVPGAPGAPHALQAVGLPALAAGKEASCRVRYSGRLVGMRVRPAFDAAHYLSAGAVGFARGLNDTPKIAALLLAASLFTPALAILCVGAAMAAGGLLGTRRVAGTMSHEVTGMNPGQGFAANVVTSLLVVGASRLGLPVSTTHVSCGSLFGIGAVTGQAHWRTIGGILFAWIVTLPVAGGLGAASVWLLGRLG